MDDDQIAIKDDLNTTNGQVADLNQKLSDLSQQISDLSQKLDSVSQKVDQFDSKYLANNWDSVRQVMMSNSGDFGNLVFNAPAIQGQFQVLQQQILDLASKAKSS